MVLAGGPSRGVSPSLPLIASKIRRPSSSSELLRMSGKREYDCASMSGGNDERLVCELAGTADMDRNNTQTSVLMINLPGCRITAAARRLALRRA